MKRSNINNRRATPPQLLSKLKRFYLKPASDSVTKVYKGFSLSVNAKDEAEADKVFGALGKGGKVVMPLGKTFYSPRFGMVTDKFGVGWMVIVPQKM